MRSGLEGMPFDQAKELFKELIAQAGPALSPEEQEELLAELREIGSRGIPDQDKSHALRRAYLLRRQKKLRGSDLRFRRI